MTPLNPVKLSRYFPIKPFGDIPVSRELPLLFSARVIRSDQDGYDYLVQPKIAFLAKFRGFLEIKNQTVLVEFESSAISAVHLAPEPIRSQSQKRE